MNCLFCDIIERKSPATIIYENNRVIVFKDIHPKAKTHLLVCPKAHYSTFMDTPNDEIAYLFKICRKIAEYMKTENGFRMTINNGPQGGQIVFHLHVHFMSWIKDIGDAKIELPAD